MLRRLLASWRRLDYRNDGGHVAELDSDREPSTRLIDQLADLGSEPLAWLRARRASPSLYSSLSESSLTAVKASHADAVANVQKAAERALRHEFDLLGSGPFVPVDPDRPARSGYQPIDWYLDPVRRLRFPRGVPHRAWNLYEMRPGNADVKYPWELARCQHWAALGQAFRLTRDDRFAREIANQLDDFMSANPVGIGINWTCTMDVALRAVSWAIGLELVHDCPGLDDEFWLRAYSALFDHGVFIRSNLENTYEVTSNHFLSNVVGLWFLAAVFADLPEGAAWTTFARASLEQEIDVQVLSDGADFESSIPYHRLVTELFLGALRLGDFRGEPLSHGYRRRVREMVAYLAAVVRPDGLMPQVGDADDGRLHILGAAEVTNPQDGRHLLGPAAAIFDEPSWTSLGGAAAAWESAWWGLNGERALRSTSEPVQPPDAAQLFSDAGVVVARTGSAYLLITNGIVGTKGFGNHKHNDQLSFEYHVDGVPLVVDPGSFVYTSDADARNLFRGTSYHNTASIDSAEQNELRPEWLFRLFETARAEHIAFRDGLDEVEYAGRHHGYERLSGPVTQERTFRLRKDSGTLDIIDRFVGEGDHQVRWHFHLAPAVDATPIADTVIELSTGRVRCSLHLPGSMSPSITPAWYSPSYGVRIPCLAVDLTTRIRLAGESVWQFAFRTSAERSDR
jgi:uncharacterized heparinase superfamily protein